MYSCVNFLNIQSHNGQFFGAQLEGYAFYSILRDHRLIPDGALCPPWCLTMTVTGTAHLHL